MSQLFQNIRFYVLLITACIITGVYLYIDANYSAGTKTIKLTQTYALLALSYLYAALLIGPLTYQFPKIPYRNQILKARRGIGVSAYFFGLLHGSNAFFFQLGGFGGLGFLTSKYLLAITLSFTALVILTLMALTSFDFMVAKLTYKKWKFLHRLVYLASFFVLVHALMLGTHFSDLSNPVAQIFFVGLAFLLILEAIRVDAFLQRKFAIQPNFGITVLLLGMVIAGYLVMVLIPADSPISLGIHSRHIQLAIEAQQTPQTNKLPQIPGLIGDKTKRFTVDFDHPDKINAKEEVELKFKVFDASSGIPVLLFQTPNEKPMHLIIVDSNLENYQHIHPTQVDDQFMITAKFPTDGRYHLYLDFQPFGAVEQQMAFSINIGNVSNIGKASESVKEDAERTKQFGEYQISLSYPKPLKASDLSVGKQIIKFTVNDNSGNPVTNLKPYLASFGHMVMINSQTYDYVHVHPARLTAVKPEETAGPDVEFMPLGLYGPIKPGIYKVFTQFNPGGELLLTEFVVKVE